MGAAPDIHSGMLPFRRTAWRAQARRSKEPWYQASLGAIDT